MKRFIQVTVMYPQSHRMQKTIMVNIDYIESVGDSGDCGLVTTPSQVILTKEKSEELMSLIEQAQTV